MQKLFKKHSFAQITKCFTLFHFLDCTFLTLCRNCISDHCRWSSHCGEHIAPHSGDKQLLFYQKFPSLHVLSLIFHCSSLPPPSTPNTHTPSYFPSLPFSYPQGTLRGFDQTVNLILAGSHERVYSTSSGVEVVQLGLYIIRGDNM